MGVRPPIAVCSATAAAPTVPIGPAASPWSSSSTRGPPGGGQARFRAWALRRPRRGGGGSRGCRRHRATAATPAPDFKQWVIRALAEVAERQEAERADEERRRRR